MNHPVHHIGIVVEDMLAARAQYEKTWGATITPTEQLTQYGLELCFVECGNTRVELLAPLDPDAPIGVFLREHGPGLHHICYQVTDLVAELRRVKELGLALIDEKPRPGAKGTMIAFLKPQAGTGTLVELLQVTAEG
jgi:methylmalonyl-CoA/ethylmalonyl-CoA epimerase